MMQIVRFPPGSMSWTMQVSPEKPVYRHQVGIGDPYDVGELCVRTGT